MSFYSVEQSRPRLHRSELAVPGSRPEMFEKAAKSDADVIFLDCEDAVAPDDKVDARKNIVTGLSKVDWNKKTMMVRINGLDTHYMYRDVIEIVEACPRLYELKHFIKFKASVGAQARPQAEEVSTTAVALGLQRYSAAPAEE